MNLWVLYHDQHQKGGKVMDTLVSWPWQQLVVNGCSDGRRSVVADVRDVCIRYSSKVGPIVENFNVVCYDQLQRICYYLAKSMTTIQKLGKKMTCVPTRIVGN